MLHRGDLLYVHNRPECAAVLAEVAERRGFRLVLHMHNSHLIRANRWQLAAMRNIPVVLCSEFLRSELNTALPHRFQSTSVIYNGADDTKFYPEQRSDTRVPQVIFTGRLVPYKGAHVLLEAMRTLQRRGVAAECKIVGGSNFGDNSRRTGYVKKLAQMMPLTRSSRATIVEMSLPACCAEQTSFAAHPSGTTHFHWRRWRQWHLDYR
jgi:glycosyltransferase involved in cell wall biosynthesis